MMEVHHYQDCPWLHRSTFRDRVHDRRTCQRLADERDRLLMVHSREQARLKVPKFQRSVCHLQLLKQFVRRDRSKQ